MSLFCTCMNVFKKSDKLKWFIVSPGQASDDQSYMQWQKHSFHISYVQINSSAFKFIKTL